MKITRENYEVFFLDYADGSLRPGEVAELMLFLEHNPDLKEEFENFENITLAPETELVFERKEELKKKNFTLGMLNTESSETYFVAYHEKDLSEKEEALVDAFLDQNPEFKNNFNLIGKTRLHADKSIVFPGKRRLKKSSFDLSYKRAIYYSVSAAAAILLLFVFLPDFSKKTKPDVITETILADNKKKIDNAVAVIAEKPEDSNILPNLNPHDVLVTVAKNSKKSNRVTNKAETKKEENNIEKESTPLIKEKESLIFASVGNNDSVKVEANFAEVTQASEINEPAKQDEFLNWKDFASIALKKKINPDAAKEDREHTRFTIWDLADAGANLVSKLTGDKWQVKREFSSDGKVSELAVVSDRFEFSKK